MNFSDIEAGNPCEYVDSVVSDVDTAYVASPMTTDDLCDSVMSHGSWTKAFRCSTTAKGCIHEYSDEPNYYAARASRPTVPAQDTVERHNGVAQYSELCCTGSVVGAFDPQFTGILDFLCTLLNFKTTAAGPDIIKLKPTACSRQIAETFHGAETTGCLQCSTGCFATPATFQQTVDP